MLGRHALKPAIDDRAPHVRTPCSARKALGRSNEHVLSKGRDRNCSAHVRSNSERALGKGPDLNSAHARSNEVELTRPHPRSGSDGQPIESSHLAPAAHEAQQHHEQVDEVEI